MLESLHQINFLYQFSLQFFLDVFSCVLTPATNPALDGKTDPAQRLSIITQALFSVSVVPWRGTPPKGYPLYSRTYCSF